MGILARVPPRGSPATSVYRYMPGYPILQLDGKGIVRLYMRFELGTSGTSRRIIKRFKSETPPMSPRADLSIRLYGIFMLDPLT